MLCEAISKLCIQQIEQADITVNRRKVSRETYKFLEHMIVVKE